MSNTNISIPTASCEVVDAPTAKANPVKLCMFMEPLTAAETIERTLRYAKDPEKYLKTILGEEGFEAKKDKFCLPEEVNIDFYGNGTLKQQFETHIAKLLGKNHGLFFITGVQAQLTAMKIYAERSGRNKLAWHVSSHLETAEADAYSKLYGFERILLGDRADALPTVEDVRAVLDGPEQDRPAAILLELPNRPFGCQTHSFADLQEISKLCKAANVVLHCDGARLWEIEPYYVETSGVSFADVCACFDSVYVSFYKALRGLTGAMLVHNEESFIEEAKIWQRRAGGNAFTLGVEVIDCQRGFNEMSGTFARKREKMIRIVDNITDATKVYQTEKGRPIVSFMGERATCAQVVTVFRGYSDEELTKARNRVEAKTGVRVFEKMRPLKTFERTLREKNEEEVWFMEWMIMSVTEKIDDHVFIDAYVNLCKELTMQEQ